MPTRTRSRSSIVSSSSSLPFSSLPRPPYDSASLSALFESYQPSSTPPRSTTSYSTRSLYGFILFSLSLLFLFLLFVWFLPDSILQSYGLTFYPARHWLSIIPAYISTLPMFIFLIYTCYNFSQTYPLNSLNVFVDSFTFQQRTRRKQELQRHLETNQPIRMPSDQHLHCFNDEFIPEIVDIDPAYVHKILHSENNKQEQKTEKIARVQIKKKSKKSKM
jgi:hypothetical protein